MILRSGRVVVMALVLALAACSSAPGESEGSPPVGSTVPPPASSPVVAPSTAATAPFPVASFTAISEEPVTEELAAKFQEALALHDVADGGGMSATVMTAEGTWSGTTGRPTVSETSRSTTSSRSRASPSRW